MHGLVVHIIAILLMHLRRLPIFTNLLSAKCEERIPASCNNIDDLLSIPDVDYWLLSRHVSHIFMPIIRRKDHVLLHMGFFAGNVGCGWLRCCVVGCEHCEGWSSSCNLHSAHTLQRSTTAPQPATSNITSKKPICSNTWSFLLMMGIKMRETCRDSSQ